MNIDYYTLFLPKFGNVNYQTATDIIIEKAKNHISFGVSALAVHGLIESIKDKKLGKKINNIDLIVPDGQPVRWALNSFYKLGMEDRVYGPTLTLHVLSAAEKLSLKVYLFGSTKNTLELFKANIKKNYPELDIVGAHIDRFREATSLEDEADIMKINDSGAHLVLVGRGCPRQEHWVADHIGKINAVMMAVGAAFDFHAGVLPQAPKWMQKSGLEWAFRLMMEPKRLWKRYLKTNSLFIIYFLYCRFISRNARLIKVGG
jgi:exopolysaccharide biosynthesis WecB/TagA/CpsF family protein